MAAPRPALRPCARTGRGNTFGVSHNFDDAGNFDTLAVFRGFEFLRPARRLQPDPYRGAPRRSLSHRGHISTSRPRTIPCGTNGSRNRGTKLPRRSTSNAMTNASIRTPGPARSRSGYPSVPERGRGHSRRRRGDAPEGGQGVARIARRQRQRRGTRRGGDRRGPGNRGPRRKACGSARPGPLAPAWLRAVQRQRRAGFPAAATSPGAVPSPTSPSGK